MNIHKKNDSLKKHINPLITHTKLESYIKTRKRGRVLPGGPWEPTGWVVGTSGWWAGG